MTDRFTESIVEDAALAWLGGLGYAILHGPEIAVDMPGAERADPGYRDVVLERRVRQALGRLTGVPQLERERVPMTRVARAGGIDQPAAAGAACGVATRT